MFEFYLNSQSDMEKNVIKNNGFEIANPLRFTIGQTPARPILRLVSRNSRNLLHSKASRKPIVEPLPDISHWDWSATNAGKPA